MPRKHKAPQGPQGCVISEDAYNRLECIMEQMKALADILIPQHATEVREITCLNLINEKCDEASRILTEAYGQEATAPK